MEFYTACERRMMFGAHFGTSGKLLLLTELSLQCCYQIIGTVRTDGIGKSPCR